MRLEHLFELLCVIVSTEPLPLEEPRRRLFHQSAVENRERQSKFRKLSENKMKGNTSGAGKQGLCKLHNARFYNISPRGINSMAYNSNMSWLAISR